MANGPAEGWDGWGDEDDGDATYCEPEFAGPALFSYLYASPLVEVGPEGPVPVPALNVTAERDLLLEVLDESSRAVAFRADVANTSTFVREMTAAKVLHVTGHGLQSGHVLFEDTRGQLHAVGTSALAELVERCCVWTRLVFVSACHSESVANVFVAAGIPHVVAVAKTDEVLDAASLEFAKGFYRLLLEGRSVGSAFSAAQAQVMFSPEIANARREGKKFMLLGHGDHDEAPFGALEPGQYIDKSPPPAQNNCDAVTECFVGRNVEVQQVVARLSEGARLVSVTGMRGVGKTQVALRAARYVGQRHMFRTIFSLAPGRRPASEMPELVAEAFGADVDADESLAEQVRRLCQAPSKYLLVFDGADSWADDDDFLELLATLLRRVPTLCVLRTGLQPLTRLASCAERVVGVRGLADVDAARLFTKRAPRLLRLDEMLRGVDVHRHADMTREETLAAFARTPIMRALRGHPSAICVVAALLSEKDLVIDEAWLLRLVPRVLNGDRADLGLNLFRASVSPHSPVFGSSASEATTPALLSARSSFNMPSITVNPALLTPDVSAALGAAGLRSWTTICSRAKVRGGAYAPWSFVANELCSAFARALPADAAERPLDDDALRFLQCEERIWGGDGSAVMSLEMFAHGWPWFEGVLFTLGQTAPGLWGRSNPILIHGFLAGGEAVRRLQGAAPGTFLFRFSGSTPGALAVSYVATDGQVQAVLLRNAQCMGLAQQGLVAPSNGVQYLFPTLASFVHDFEMLTTLHPGVALEQAFPQ